MTAPDDVWPEVAAPGGGLRLVPDLPSAAEPKSEPPMPAGEGLPAERDGVVVNQAARRAAISPPAGDDGGDRAQLPDGVVRCSSTSCGAPIRWVVTESGKRMPVDVDPDPHGNMLLVNTPAGWRMRVLPPGDPGPVDGDDRRWVSHFVTCVRAVDHRKPRPVPKGAPAPVRAATATPGPSDDQSRRKPEPARPAADGLADAPFTCQSPHPEPRPARLYAGGRLCDACVALAVAQRQDQQTVWQQNRSNK